MAAWETFDWDNMQTRVRAKSSITPTKDDVRSILKIINGIDKAQSDAPPSSVSGKCHYYTKVFFSRTPWLHFFLFVIFIVTFSITVDGLLSMQDELGTHALSSKSAITLLSDRSLWLGIILGFCILINLLNYLFSLCGSQFCLAKRCSKWGSSFICSLYFLRMFEGFLFFLSCIALVFVGLDGIGLVSNSNTIACLSVLCKSSNQGVQDFTQHASHDKILSSFIDIRIVSLENVDSFCEGIQYVRDMLPSYWYANFIALIAQIILTICAYQNYMITKAVWESSLYGSEVELELKKRRSEREAAIELKKKQKEQKKLAKKELESSVIEKRTPGSTLEKKKSASRSSVRSAKRTPAAGDSTFSAYGGNSNFSAYDKQTTTSYVSDSDSSCNRGGAEDIEDNSTTPRSSTTMTNNAFDGGEWWKE